MKERKKETIRKGVKHFKKVELFLYGKLRHKSNAVAYCNLHKCYLEKKDIKEKKCNKKKCTHIREI